MAKKKSQASLKQQQPLDQTDDQVAATNNNSSDLTTNSESLETILAKLYDQPQPTDQPHVSGLQVDQVAEQISEADEWLAESEAEVSATNEPKTLLVFDEATTNHHIALIEATLYLSGELGATIHTLKRVLKKFQVNSEYLHGLIKKMQHTYSSDYSKGVELVQYQGTFKLVTKAALAPDLSKIIKLQLASALTPSLLEVLAIIAYHHPCTKSTIWQIRQIDPSNSIERLLKLQLIKKAKRAETPGNPWLYKLTPNFYDLFGIKSLSQLPKIATSADLAALVENQEISGQSFFDSNRFDVDVGGEYDE